MSIKTKAHAFANDFDCELFRLISKAQDPDRRPGDKDANNEWRKIASKLIDARELVRRRMHISDVKATQ